MQLMLDVLDIIHQMCQVSRPHLTSSLNLLRVFRCRGCQHGQTNLHGRWSGGGIPRSTGVAHLHGSQCCLLWTGWHWTGKGWHMKYRNYKNCRNHYKYCSLTYSWKMYSNWIIWRAIVLRKCPTYLTPWLGYLLFWSQIISYLCLTYLYCHCA